MSNSGLVWAISFRLTSLESCINLHGISLGFGAPRNEENEKEYELYKAQRSFLTEIKDKKREIPDQIVVNARLENIQAQIAKREKEIRDLHAEESRIIDEILTHCPSPESVQEAEGTVPRIMTPINS